MKCFNKSTLIALLLTPLTALSQSTRTSDTPQTPPAVRQAPSRPEEDWNRVRNLEHDEEINVWASRNRRFRCLFTGATDDDLFCEPLNSRWQDQSNEYRFHRVDVEKIRLEQGQRNFKIAITATTVAGVVAGAALTNTKYGGARVIGGLAGGLAGTMAGAIIAVPIAIFVPGQLVYQKPGTRPSPRAASPLSSKDRPPDPPRDRNHAAFDDPDAPLALGH